VRAPTFLTGLIYLHIAQFFHRFKDFFADYRPGQRTGVFALSCLSYVGARPLIGKCTLRVEVEFMAANPAGTFVDNVI